jgi:hypothetical protein
VRQIQKFCHDRMVSGPNPFPGQFPTRWMFSFRLTNMFGKDKTETYIGKRNTIVFNRFATLVRTRLGQLTVAEFDKNGLIVHGTVECPSMDMWPLTVHLDVQWYYAPFNGIVMDYWKRAFYTKQIIYGGKTWYIYSSAEQWSDKSRLEYKKWLDGRPKL